MPNAAATIFNEDCINGLANRLDANSVHLAVTSIPFEELFTYSGKPEDVGNNGSTVDIRAGRFALNMRFVVEQLLRVTAPGCNVCIHIQQLLAYRNQHGFSGRRDFRGAMIEVFGAGGFMFTGEFVIAKNPQSMAQRLNLHSLQFKTGHSRSSTDWAMCPNDYVLIFQKPGEPAVPVRPLVYHPSKNPTSPERFFEIQGRKSFPEYVAWLREWAVDNKAKNPGGWLTTEEWVRDANGIWNDILEIDVLDGARNAKETDEEKHVCPLQLEVIRRCVRLYTNPISVQPDVLVLDPFMGIGSTAYVCLGGVSPVTRYGLEEPRNVVGFELKESYHAVSLKNVKRAEKSRKAVQPVDLFAGEPA